MPCDWMWSKSSNREGLCVCVCDVNRAAQRDREVVDAQSKSSGGQVHGLNGFLRSRKDVKAKAHLWLCLHVHLWLKSLSLIINVHLLVCSVGCLWSNLFLEIHSRGTLFGTSNIIPKRRGTSLRLVSGGNRRKFQGKGWIWCPWV